MFLKLNNNFPCALMVYITMPMKLFAGGKRSIQRA
jgi:hypothetical protein